MDLNRVATFVLVVERGGITRAAETLGLPKSSVSRSIAKLEQELGVALLHRAPRKVTLTDAGRAFFDRARAGVGAIEEASVIAADAVREPSGLVRLAAPVELNGRLLAEPIASFTRRFPRIQVDVLITNRAVDLVEEGLDLALTLEPPRDTSLVARVVREVPYALFASPAYLHRRGEPKKPADLAQHACILARLARGHETWTLVGPRGEHRVQVNGSVGANQYGLALELAVEGLGIALLPTPIGRLPVEQRRLAPVLPAMSAKGPSVAIVSTATRQLPNRVALFRDHLLAELARHPCAKEHAFG